MALTSQKEILRQSKGNYAFKTSQRRLSIHDEPKAQRGASQI